MRDKQGKKIALKRLLDNVKNKINCYKCGYSLFKKGKCLRCGKDD